ncbi:hypothetical protein CBR_g34522 [Chara braunii]|uniref:Reverse transcriptase RNase H-like domain-containing protein n=1 Tax=Chara braunii TaxID=69332 RepID=A0A388LIU5_CHABU|nr:hypothetical protein CBR_g34522 [Chara braunii]|eukprot:GBG82239.1 hypothetical protein CBR_g34522 [Chara braunii]
MPEEMADGGRKLVTLDDLIDALDKRERAPSNVPKVDTFHFKGERVSDWLDLTEQALVGLSDKVKLQDMMQRKYRLGDGLLTMADLEAMNKDDFSTIGAFVHEFKRKVRKVHGISKETQCAIFLGLLTGSEASELTGHGGGNEKLTWATIDKGVEEGSLDQVEQHQVRLQRRKRKERDATASGIPRVKRIITDVLAALRYDNEAELQKRGMTVAQRRASGAVEEEARREDYGGEETGSQILTKAQRKQRNLQVGGQGSGKGQVPQAIAAPPPVATTTSATVGPSCMGPPPACGHWVSHCQPTSWPSCNHCTSCGGSQTQPGKMVPYAGSPASMGPPNYPAAQGQFVAQPPPSQQASQVSVAGGGNQGQGGQGNGGRSQGGRGGGGRGRGGNGGDRGGGWNDQRGQDQGGRGSQGGGQGYGRPRFDWRNATYWHCGDVGHTVRFCERRREDELSGLISYCMDEDINDKWGEHIDPRTPGGIRQEDLRRAAVGPTAPPAMFRMWQEKEEPTVRVEEIMGDNEEVNQRLKAGAIREEPIVVESDDEGQEGEGEPATLLLGRMKDLLEKKCTGMVDTGAEMNIIREKEAVMIGMEIDRSDHGMLHGANCKAAFCGTASNVIIEIGKVRARTCFFVMPDVDHPILLGRSFLCRTEMLIFNKHDGTMILLLCDPACGNYEVVTCRNTGPRSGRNRPNLGSFIFEESENERRRLWEVPEEEDKAEVLTLSLTDVNKAMEEVSAHDMADPEAISKALREQVFENPQVGEVELVFWRSFVKDFATKTEHLRKLVRQDQEWVWGEDQEEAVGRMKGEFKEGGLVLGAPNYEATEERPFVIETDAGPTALGGVLIQADTEGKERPLRFESRTLNTTERNYSQFKKETLAVLHCLRTFRNYVFGRRLILRVDPSALACSLKNYTPSDPTVARWLTYIWMFNFKLERISGNKKRADGLSRINWDGSDEESIEDTPPVDGFFYQEEDVRLHINEWSLRVPSCVSHPIWLALKGYEQKEELVLKPFEEEDPWGSKDVGWMMKLALAGTHSLVEEVRAIEEGLTQVEEHDQLMGGMYLLTNTLLQGDFDRKGSFSHAEGEILVPESRDDEFEEGEIKEAFRAEEYDGIYRELGLLLSCEMRDRDASAKAQKMRHLYVVEPEGGEKAGAPTTVAPQLTESTGARMDVEVLTSGEPPPGPPPAEEGTNEGDPLREGHEARIGRPPGETKEEKRARVQGSARLDEARETEDMGFSAARMEMERTDRRIENQAWRNRMEAKEAEWEKRLQDMAAIVERLSTTKAVDWTEQSRYGIQGKKVQGLFGQEGTTETPQQEGMAKVFLDPAEAAARREAKERRFSFRTPTELASQ